MMNIRFTFEGGSALAAALDQLPFRAAKTTLQGALEEGAEPMRAAIARHAPVGAEAPHIAGNIGIGVPRTKDAPAAVVIGPVRGFAYGLPLELGSRHSRAEPFMRPGFDESIPATLDLIGAVAWRELAGRGISRPTEVADESVAIGGPGGGLT